MLKILGTEVIGETLSITGIVVVMYLANQIYLSDALRSTGHYALEIQKHQYLFSEYQVRIAQPLGGLLILLIGGTAIYRIKKNSS